MKKFTKIISIFIAICILISNSSAAILALNEEVFQDETAQYNSPTQKT